MKRLVSIPVLVVLIFCFSPTTHAASSDKKRKDVLTAAEEQITKADTSGKVFSLSECVATALENDPQILYSQADISEKEYSLKSSRKDLIHLLPFNMGIEILLTPILSLGSKITTIIHLTLSNPYIADVLLSPV